MNRSLFFLTLLATPALHAALSVHGDATTAPFGFTNPITASTFDTRTGSFFVGTDNPSGTNDFSIAVASRTQLHQIPTFSGITPASSALHSATVEFLSAAQQPSGAPLLAAVKMATNPLSATSLTALSANGKQLFSSSALNDSTGSATSAGIIRIAAGATPIFAAVRPNGGNFGATGGGLTYLNLLLSNHACLINDGTLTGIQTKDAQTGLNGNRAVNIDGSSVQLKGSGPNSVTFPAETVSSVDINLNQGALHWDEYFERVYLGVRIQTGASSADLGKSVVVARITNANILALEHIVADGAISAGLQNEIVVAAGTNIDLRALQLGVMHASTGPSYLIVNGGKGNTQSTGNLIYALPLVDNPSSPTTHGTLARKDSALANHRFVTPATASGHLPDAASSTDIFVHVGDGPVPIAASNSISQMIVLGDTVYVSVAHEPTSTNDSGIFYAQALFDDTGKIIRWTPWVKRAVPLNAFPTQLLPGGDPHAGGVSSFAVDAVTQAVWFVESTTEKTVGLTSWMSGAPSIDLAPTINKYLKCGCFAALDLHQATRGFAGNTVHRYALFGGQDKVLFTRVSEAVSSTFGSPQTPITDFSSPDNFMLSTLPAPAGAIQTLEYAQRLETVAEAGTSYFFAGTENGLFVFADQSGNGFSPNVLSTLDQPPFSTGQWFKAPNISGSVIDLRSSGSGNVLFVLTQEATNDPKHPLKNTLYACVYDTSVATTFASPRIIAQTGTGTFATIFQFFGIGIIYTDVEQTNPTLPNVKEQLVLATNQGLYRSNADQIVNDALSDAVNQTDANWIAIFGTESTYFQTIESIDTPTRHTVWPLSTQNGSCQGIFNQSGVHQISGRGTLSGQVAAIGGFVPTDFTQENEELLTLNSIEPVVGFWSDGLRRIFITAPGSDGKSRLISLPFDAAQWNKGVPHLLSSSALHGVHTFYWVRQIGSSGLLMAGTNTGVVAMG